jgi:hypothetical protein
MQPVAAASNVLPFIRPNGPPQAPKGPLKAPKVDSGATSKRGQAIVVKLPSSDPDTMHATFDEVAELYSWASASEAKGWFVEAEADPAAGQLERVGRMPNGSDFVSIAIDHRISNPGMLNARRHPPHIRLEKREGKWGQRVRAGRRWKAGDEYDTLRGALECICATVQLGLRPAKPEDPPEGYSVHYGDRWWDRRLDAILRTRSN